LAVSGARAGFGGPYDVLGSTRGLIAVYNEKADVSKLETKPGQPLKIEGIYLKPYAACRHCHPSIEAALKIRDKYQLQHEDIKSVIIKTYKWAVGGHDHVKVYGTNSAKMSIPYSVAVALVTGKAGLEEFLPDRINDIQVQSLTPRVSIYQDDELSSLVPEKRAAIVEIFTINGSKYQERIDYPKGEPENPLSDEEIRDKFLSLAMFAGKSEIEAHTIYENIINDSFELEKITPLIS
jgi:2-methylcitrate dehydratase PrpD